jgi:hypothetical protein
MLSKVGNIGHDSCSTSSGKTTGLGNTISCESRLKVKDMFNSDLIHTIHHTHKMTQWIVTRQSLQVETSFLYSSLLIIATRVAF